MMFSYIFWMACATLEDLEQQVDLQYQEWCSTSQKAQVERVYDGDTAFLYGQEEGIRFLGVAAPEVDSSSGEGDCFGEESRDFLKALIEEQEIVLEYDVECTDIYNRELAWIFLEGNDAQVVDWMTQYGLDGLDGNGNYRLLVNELIIRLGYASIFRGEVAKNIRYTDRIERAEEEAKEEMLGLWSSCP